MKYLQSSIALRIVDNLGIFTKDMPKIKNDFFKVKNDNRDIWAVQTAINSENILVFIYMETEDIKYLISTFKSKDKKSKAWVCIVCGDDNEENPEANRVFIMNFIKDDWMLREADTIELANMLVTYESIKHFFSGWAQYDVDDDDMKIFNKFISSIYEEDVEE